MTVFARVSLFVSTALVASLFLVQEAQAQRRVTARPSLSGDMSLGLGISMTSAGQDDLNGAIDDAVAGGANVKNLGSAWEFYANWSYRFTGSMYAMVLRPSYFMQSADGNGPGGDYKYDLTGYTIMPMLRIYALENYFIKFYFQTGLGYGSLQGSIKNGTNDLEFSGSAFGATGGIGVDFCFSDAHCLTVEGNMRYMPIERNLTKGGNCTNGSMSGISQCGGTSEVERNGADLKTTLSGLQALVGYTMNF